MKTYCLEISGDFACFTRPEMKVERVSYDVMTPSAARAVFEAILWKPAMRWRVRMIEVIKPIKWINLRRNEVGALASPASRSGLYVEDKRQQRAGLFLRDVQYRIHASFELRGPGLSKHMVNGEGDAENKEPDLTVKFMTMFERRATRGQCVNQPYLGCREFAADFRLVEPGAGLPVPVKETRDLGYMLYDWDYSDPADPKPRLFRADLKDGVVKVPAWNSEEVRG